MRTLSNIFILFLVIFGLLLSTAHSATATSEACVNVQIYNPISNEISEKCFKPPVTFIKTGMGYCAQVTVYAISPDKTCGEFSTPCDIPFNWEWVDSCDNPQIIETPGNTVIGGRNVFTDRPMGVVIEGLGNINEQYFEADTVTITPTAVTINAKNEQGESVITTTNTSRDSDFPTIINAEVANSKNKLEEINILPLPEEGIIVIESEGVTATTTNDILLINSILVINDDGQLYPVDFLPHEVLEKVEKQNKNAIEVDEIELTVQDGAPVYIITGTRAADFLFIIPVTMEIVSVVNAQSGEIISEETPFWSFLAKLKEDEVQRKELPNDSLFDEIKKEANKKIREEIRKG